MTDEQAVLDAFDALNDACEGSRPDAIVDLFTGEADTTFWGSAVDEEAVGPRELPALADAIGHEKFP